MNISQSQLTQIEQDLISLVLDFHFDLGHHSPICLNGINSQIDISPIMSAEYYTETFDVKLLHCIKQELENQSAIAKRDFYSSIKNSSTIYDSLSDDEKCWDYDKEPFTPALKEFKKMRDKVGMLEEYWGKLGSTIQSIEDAIFTNGIIKMQLLGNFCSEKMRIYLYLENIIQTAKGYRREYVLVTTFIHEMLHAWNYFACGQRDRTVREIDEAMVEFATLCFLKQISQVHSEFEPILEWAEHDIKNKQTAIGSIAAYGYGYYLFSKYLKDVRQVLELFTSYSKNSGLIQPSSSARYIETMLYPSYPYNREEELYKKIQNLLRSSYKATRNEGRKSGIRITNDGQTDIFSCQETLHESDYGLHKHAKNEVLEKISRKQQIIDALRLLRGYAKLEDLYKIVDTSTWGTKTPKASIRQILQLHQEFFNIRSGVWGLEEYRNQIENQIKQGYI